MNYSGEFKVICFVYRKIREFKIDVCVFKLLFFGRVDYSL